MEKVKFIVGITGGSGVGKTTLIEGLRDEFKGHVSTFSLDNYYLPKEQQEKDDNGVINFDLPTALDVKAMQKDFDSLLRGNVIKQSVYNFNNPHFKEEYLEIAPRSLLIVEGLFVMHYEFLRAALNYSVYLSVDPEIQLERRLIRDVNERNYSKDDVIYQWENHVLPSYESYVRPYKQQADLIITNNESFDENIHILTSVIHQNLD
ncbi:MAG: AAA family ATPase [Crocinitomicaceae bacterium]|nr:AAA family ATPase [Crocinitomicaceae bacterium]